VRLAGGELADLTTTGTLIGLTGHVGRSLGGQA
jgi:hypothetical protein